MELEELIRQIDIVEFIGQYVELTQKNDEFWGQKTGVMLLA